MSRSVLCYFCLVIFLCGSLDRSRSVQALETIDLMKSIFYAIYTPNSKAVTDETCRDVSQMYHDALMKNTPWALKMIDSSSKIQPGIFSGNLVDLGQFSQCLTIDENVNNTEIKGQHCLASLNIQLQTKHQPNLNVHLTRSAQLFSGMPQSKATKRKSQTFKWSICVPSVCSSEDVENHLEYTIGKLFQTPVNVTVKPANCQSVATRPSWRTSDWVMLSFLIIVALLLLGQTAYETYLIYFDLESIHPILTSFSIITNGKQLTHISRSKDQFHCLHGIRWFSMMWVIIGHRYMFTALAPLTNPTDVQTWLTRVTSFFPIGGTVAVDTFFVMGGMLLMFIYLKTKAANKPFNIPLMYIHRYLRLTPPVVIALLFVLTLSRFVGSGPLWPTFSTYELKNCEKNWWSLLLYVQNYVNPTKMCLSHTWYLSADMQLFFLSPLIMIPLYKWPKYCGYVLGALIGVFIIVPLTISIEYDLSASVVKMSTEFFKVLYLPTHTRAATYLIGIGLGYIMFQKKKTIVEISPLMNTIAWSLSLGIMFVVTLTQYPMSQESYVRNNILEGFYNGLHRVAWSIALSWLIFACSFGYGGPINWLLSLPVFQVLARLTYCMYIVHFSMLIYRMGSLKTVPYFDDMNVYVLLCVSVHLTSIGLGELILNTGNIRLYEYGGDLLFTTLLGLVWTLSFELPFANIESIMFNGKAKKRVAPTYNENCSVKVILDDVEAKYNSKL